MTRQHYRTAFLFMMASVPAVSLAEQYVMRQTIENIRPASVEDAWTEKRTEGAVEWVGDGYDCSGWSPFDSTVLHGQSFLQSRTCQQDKAQVITVIKENSITGERIVDETTSAWTDTESEHHNATGSLTFASCQALKAAMPSLSSGSYQMDSGSQYCEMDKAGGGWTRIHVESGREHSGIKSQIGINDQGLNYTEVLYVDTGSIYDHATPWNNKAHEWRGYHPKRNAFKINGVWSNIELGYAPSGAVPGKLPSSSYSLVQSNGHCYGEPNKKDAYCATVATIYLGAGKRIQGLSDNQSVGEAHLTNNYFQYRFELYVR